ncbi:MAG: T9SS type A sorting domain-containing protein, partial [Bacteroidota bacterium]
VTIKSDPVSSALSRLFVKMRTSNTDHAVRIDIIDSTGLISNATAVTKVVGNEFTVLEYSFDGLVADGGFGGSPCTMETAPCLLDPTAITQLLFYIDAADGGFEGDLIIDYVAFGQELGDDPIITPTGVVNHTDQFNDQSGLFLGTTGGITNGFMDGAITLTGDGTSGAFAAIPYDLHDETGTLLIADAAVTGDSLFIRARSTTAVDLRIDLEDNQGFATTNAGITNSLSSDYQVLSYVYTNSYTDGGFGGTSCTMETAPCAVDAQRIAKLVFYPAPNVGAYDGTIDIDWISFGRSLLVTVDEVPELEALQIFPNPVKERLGLSYHLLESGNVGFQIFDGMGRRVFTHAPSFRTNGDQFDQADLSSLSPGIYYLQLNFNGRTIKGLTIIKS